MKDSINLDIPKSVHKSARSMYALGLISDERMREYDQMCRPPMRPGAGEALVGGFARVMARDGTVRRLPLRKVPAALPGPADAAGWVDRGNAVAALGKYRKAIKSYGEAIRIRPELAAAWFNRGNAKAALKRCGEAFEDYDEAIRLLPAAAAHVWFSRGNAKALLGRRDEAIRHYDEALRLSPGHVDALLGRGGAQEGLARLERAIGDYDAAIRLAPGNADAWLRRGAARALRGRHAEAIGDYGHALRADARHADTWGLRGLAKLRQAPPDLVGAIADFDEALRLFPDYPMACWGRGRAKQALGRLRAAEEDYHDALALEPDHLNALASRGRVMLLQARRRDAIADFERIRHLVSMPVCGGCREPVASMPRHESRGEPAAAGTERVRALAPQPRGGGCREPAATSAACLCLAPDRVGAASLSEAIPDLQRAEVLARQQEDATVAALVAQTIQPALSSSPLPPATTSSLAP